MPCGCSKKNAPNGFVWSGPEGQSQDTRTEIEAKALVVRQGGTYEPKK